MLTLKKVSFAYPNGPKLLDNVSFSFAEGSFTLIQGESGIGKSTLLRLLCLLEEPQSGHISFMNRSITSYLPSAFRRRVAYVQQTPTLLKGTLRKNILLPFSFQSNKDIPTPTEEQLEELLASFKLHCMTLETQADTLSVGQAQRLCFMRSLLLEPEVILLDEPTSALDTSSARIVIKKATDFRDRGKTVIMISHSEKTPSAVTDSATLMDGKLEKL